MRNFLKRKSVCIVFLLIVFVQLACYEYLYLRADRITPKGHVHAMRVWDEFYPDVIRQSKLGSWGYTYTLTTLPTPKVYSYFFLIGAGKIAQLGNIDPVTMYEITRITGALAVFFTTYWLITILLPATIHIPALLFTLVFESGPLWGNIFGTPLWQFWAFEPPVISRHFGFPHHLWGEAFGLALICMIAKAIQKPSRITPVIIVLLSVFGPLTSPTYYAILVMCLFPVWILYAVVTKTLRRTLPPVVLAAAGIVCVGVFTKAQFSVGPPWTIFTSTEKLWWTTDTVMPPFIQAMTLYYPFVALLFILIPVSWAAWSTSIRRTFFLALGWSLLPVGLIYLCTYPWIPLVNGRIVSDLSPVPIGILATLVFYKAGHAKYLRLLFLLVLAGSLVLTMKYINQMIKDQDSVLALDNTTWAVYPTRDVWNGVMALKNVPIWSHIMVGDPYLGDLIHAYIPVFVYQGNSHGETDYDIRRNAANLFYSGEMTRDAVRKLFTDNAISYVFYGPKEKVQTRTQALYPDIMRAIYSNPDVTIYKVQ